MLGTDLELCCGLVDVVGVFPNFTVYVNREEWHKTDNHKGDYE